MNANTPQDPTAFDADSDAPTRPQPSPQGSTQRSGRSRALRHVRTTMRFVDLGFYALYGLILLQIALEGLGARDGNAFKQFLDRVSAPFLDPFRGLLQDPAMENHQVMLSFIAALIIYALLQGLIRKTVGVIVATTLQSTSAKAQAQPRSTWAESERLS